jgi:hypothetical protein
MQLSGQFHAVAALPLVKTPPSKFFIEFCRSNSGIVGSNRSQDVFICMRIFCVRVVLCRLTPSG